MPAAVLSSEGILGLNKEIDHGSIEARLNARNNPGAQGLSPRRIRQGFAFVHSPSPK